MATKMKLMNVQALTLVFVGLAGCCSSKYNAGTSAPRFSEYEVRSKCWDENRQFKVRMVNWSEITCGAERLAIVAFGNPETKQVTCLEFYRKEPKLTPETLEKLILIGRDNRYEPITAFRPAVRGTGATFEVTRETPAGMAPRKRWIYTLQYVNGRLMPDLSEWAFDLAGSK